MTTDKQLTGPAPDWPTTPPSEWMRGVIPVLTTPFDEDDAVDFGSFRRVVEDVCRVGVNAVMVPGFGSEHWKLSDAEKDDLVGVARQVTAESAVRLIASISDEATVLAKCRAVRYQELGADALNLLPPRLGAVSRHAVLEHLGAVAAATPNVPVIVQYVPGEGGVPLDPTDFAAVSARHPNVVAVKVESRPARPYVAALKALRPPMLTLVGNGGMEMLHTLTVGADGIQPGSGFAGVYVEIWRRWERGDEAGARELFALLLSYLAGWAGDGLSALVGKEIARRRGVIVCVRSRRPGPVLDQATLEEVDRFCADFADCLGGNGEVPKQAVTGER